MAAPNTTGNIDPVDALKKKLATKAAAPKAPAKSDLGRSQNPWAGGAQKSLFGTGQAPFTTTGPVGDLDRPYSWHKAIQLAYNEGEGREYAKVEAEASDNLAKLYAGQYWSHNISRKSVFIPFGHQFLPQNAADAVEFKRLREQVLGANNHFDPDEIKSFVKTLNLDVKAQSYLESTLGGALLGGPVVGELIDILRPKTPFSRANWSALPPLGLRMPRVASVGRATAARENQQVTASSITFSPLELKPKKVMQIIDYPNEMIAYGSPSISGWMASILAEQLGVEMAYLLLSGDGSDTEPFGLKTMADLQSGDPTNYAFGLNLINARNPKYSPQDAYRFPKAVERRNGGSETDEWIGHPDSFWAFLEARASAIAANDQQGPFVYDFARAARNGFPDELVGRRFNKTTLVSVSDDNATENTTWLAYLNMARMYIGTIGAVEISTSVEAGERWERDQTGLRAKTHFNGTPERTSEVAIAISMPVPNDEEA